MPVTVTDRMTTTPTLPRPRGPLTEWLDVVLSGRPPAGEPPLHHVERAEPLGDDLQLALHVCYELHYRGFATVHPDWEWDPDLLRFRGAMERRFQAALHEAVPGGDDVAGALDPLLVERVDATGVAGYLRDRGTWPRMREYLVHRSIYQLKEADPHAWVVPRLRGRAKASLVAVEVDEFGGGAGRAHAHLFADLLLGAGLDPSYLGYLDDVPAVSIAVVNLMSMFGLHRALRGALVGHLAAAETSTAPSADKLARALRRLGAPPACLRFFPEHTEGDAVHEQLTHHDVVGGLLEQEPRLAADVVFGVRATQLLEDRLADHLLGAWNAGRSSLRRPLPAPTEPPE
jgi:hypothetical protein